MILEGENIVLRKLRVDDAESLVKHGDNPKIARNLRDVFPSPYTLEAARDWIETCTTDDHFKNTLAITIADECIGMAGLEPRPDVHRNTLGLGYWIGEAFWGQGYVTEAVNLLCADAFRDPKVARIEAGVFEWNPASARVLEKCGFEFEGRLRKSVFKDGQLIDQLLYAKVRR